MPYSTPYGKECKICVCSGEPLPPRKEADLALSRVSQHPGRSRGGKGALSRLRERLRAWLHVRCPMQDDIDLKQQKRIRELPLFLAAKENRPADIRTWMARELFDPSQRGAVGETALHVAALYGSTEAASTLLDAAPTLINEPMTSELYAGQVALHIAVLNQNLNLVTELVERGAYVSTPKATGTFFQRRPQNLIYVGEHILSFAACMGNPEIVHLLIKNGANIKAQDSLGNTVLHILALQPNKAMSCQMFDFILSYEKGTKGTPLEKVSNKDGLTPFKLAAVEGNTEMFQHMVQKRKRVQRLLGPVSSTLYELSDIDSGGDGQSVLELVTSTGSREAYRTLGVTPVKELVYEKWKRYKGSYFSASGFSYVLYMVCFSLCCVNRPMKPRRPRDPNDGQLFTERTLQESYVTSQDYLRLVGELVSVTGAIAILLLQITDVLHAGCQRFFRKAMWAEPFSIMIITFALLVLLILVQRVSNADGEETPMCLALILGWCYTMYFSRGLKMLGPFTIMIQRMAVGDLWRFCWILAVVTVGYSAAYYVALQEVQGMALGAFYNYPMSLVSTYELFSNILNGPANYTVHLPPMYSPLYGSFCMIAFLLMFNLLIATLGETYSGITQEKEGLWLAQIAAAATTVEHRLPQRLWLRAGIPGKEYGLKDRWYINVEDRHDSKSSKQRMPQVSDQEEDESDDSLGELETSAESSRQLQDTGLSSAEPPSASTSQRAPLWDWQVVRSATTNQHHGIGLDHTPEESEERVYHV